MVAPQKNTTPLIHSIPHFLIGLSRYLRKDNFTIGAAEIKEATQVLMLNDAVYGYPLLRESLKVVWVKKRSELIKFDELFDQYWEEQSRGANAKEKHQEESKPRPTSRPTIPTIDALKSWLYNEAPEEEKKVSGYDDISTKSQIDIADWTMEDQTETNELVKQIARSLSSYPSRRMEASKKGKLHIRGMLRKNLPQGDMVHLSFVKPKMKKIKVAILCDVSRSMDLYSRFFIQFALAFKSLFRRISLYSFATDMEKISFFDDGKANIKNMGSGTNIDASIKTFIDKYMRHSVDKNTTIVVLSDGWDSADHPDIAHSFWKMKKASKRIIWLNPLMSNPNFSPETSALKAALPYIDQMLPAHNLASLKSVLHVLRKG